LANIGTVGFTFNNAEVNATYEYTFSSSGGGTPITGDGTITEPNQQINGIDLTGLPDGLVTLTVFLANPNGVGIEVTDTVTLDTSLPVDCDGGNSAPPLDPTEPTIFCDEIDVDLNDYLTSTDAPAGTVLTWGVDADTNDESTHLGGSRAGSSGLYYGFYYDAANNCSSPYVEVLLVSNDTPLIDLDVTQGGSIC